MSSSMRTKRAQRAKWEKRAGRPAHELFGLLFGLLLAAGCATAPDPIGVAPRAPVASAAPSDADLFALVPAGPRLLFEVDLAVVRGSVWTAGLLAGGGSGADAIARANQRAALGYDDAVDVDRMVYALTVLDASRPTLVIAQGRFAPAQVEEAFRARWAGARVSARRGISVLVEGENSLAFITPRTFVSGPPAEVLAAVDLAFGVGDPLAADAGLGPLWRALATSAGVPGGGPAVRGVASLDGVVRARVASVWAVPAAITEVGLRVELGRTLDLDVLALTADRSAAGALARGWSATARAPQMRRLAGTLGLGALLGGLGIGAEGARVHVTSSVDESQRPEVTQALRAILAQLRGG
jgi:hypothetical protein